jgi:hypothetical protein
MSSGSLFGGRAGHRPWYEWIVWALWLVFEVFLMQNAVASGQELEPRAATIFWIIFAVVLAGGAIVWFARRARLLKA